MTDVNKLNKGKFVREVLQKGKRKIDLKYFKAKRDNICNINTPNLELNKLNIRELSKLSDRPIQQKKEHYNKKINIFSKEKAQNNSNYNINIKNIKTENNIYLNNNSNYNNYMPNHYKNLFIIEGRPKKLSDYILKDKSASRRKVYKLIFIEDEEENRNRRPYNYVNSEYNQNLENKDINFYSYNKLKQYNDLYFKNNSVDRRNKSPLNNISKIKSKRDEKRYTNRNNRNIIKIQSFWRGYRTRKINKKKLKIIPALKIYRIISNNFIFNSKSYIKIFLAKLKKIYNNSSIIHNKLERKKLNQKSKIYVNQNKNNINAKNSYNNYIYNKKNQHIGFSSSFNKRNSNNIQVHNLKTIPKKVKNNYNILKSPNYKNQIEKEILKIIKYIFRKNCFLHYPMILYRLKILQRMNLFERRYNCLLRIIKIKTKLLLFQYFQKYKNIIKSESKKSTNIKSGKIEFKNNIEKSNNKNQIKINLIKKYSQNKNELNYLEKRNSIMLNILNKIDLKSQKLLLGKYFNIWKNILKVKKIIISIKRNKFDSSSNIMHKYKSSASAKKRQIKIKKLKSNYNNSKIMSKSIGKNNINSFYSENISIKKMHVSKINILIEPNDIKKEGINKINAIVKKNSSDNSYFISKIKNVANKINLKNNMSKCFKLWKKKSNLN